MKREELDAILNGMLNSADERASDLVFVVGKPPQIEDDGQLNALELDGPDSVLQPAHIQQMADLLMQDNDRLRDDFANNGSCDGSYALDSRARFRVNIYKQNGQQAIVMRRLESKVPSLAELKLPPVFYE